MKKSNLKKYRKFLILIGSLIIIIALIGIIGLTQFTPTESKMTYSNSITENVVISVGSVKLKVTDQEGNPLRPMTELDIDTGYTYRSDSYKIRVENIGTLPLKFQIVPKNVGGDEALINSISFRGYIDDTSNADYTSVNYGILKDDLRLIRCNYLKPGEYRDISLKLAIARDESLENLACTYDIYIQAMQAEPME